MTDVVELFKDSATDIINFNDGGPVFIMDIYEDKNGNKNHKLYIEDCMTGLLRVCDMVDENAYGTSYVIEDSLIQIIERLPKESNVWICDELRGEYNGNPVKELALILSTVDEIFVAGKGAKI